ncbi:MAG: hypothetical protein WCI61_08075, partial [Chloroflexota bacterium]
MIRQSEDRELRVLASDGDVHWLWRRGSSPERLPAGSYGGFSPNGRYLTHTTDDWQTPEGMPSRGPYEGKPFTFPLSLLDTRTLALTLVMRLQPCGCDVSFAPPWSPSGRFFVVNDFSGGGSLRRRSFLLDTGTGRKTSLDGAAWGWAPTRDRLVIETADGFVVRDMQTGDAAPIGQTQGDLPRWVTDNSLLITGPSDTAALWSLISMTERPVSNGLMVARSPSNDRLVRVRAGTCGRLSVQDVELIEQRCIDGEWAAWAPNGEFLAVTRGRVCREGRSEGPIE